jgi:phage tail sheath protein FI
MIEVLARRFCAFGGAVIALVGTCGAAQPATVKLSCRVHVTQEKTFSSSRPKEQTTMDEVITVEIVRAGKMLWIKSIGSKADFAVQAERKEPPPEEIRHGDIVDLSGPNLWFITWDTGDSTHPADIGNVQIDRNTGQLAYSRLQLNAAFSLSTNMSGSCEKVDVNKRKF